MWKTWWTYEIYEATLKKLEECFETLVAQILVWTSPHKLALHFKRYHKFSVTLARNHGKNSFLITSFSRYDSCKAFDISVAHVLLSDSSLFLFRYWRNYEWKLLVFVENCKFKEIHQKFHWFWLKNEWVSADFLINLVGLLCWVTKTERIPSTRRNKTS
jgi:hypothetical protein